MELSVGYATDLVKGLFPLIKSGVIWPFRPDRLAKVGIDALRWTFTPSALTAIAAHRNPNQVAIIDDLGTLTYKQLFNQSKKIAENLTSLGAGEKTKVGILARNHRVFPLVMSSVSLIGGDVVLLSTGSSANQLESVMEAQKVDFLFIDEEFLPIMPKSFDAGKSILSWGSLDNAEGKVKYHIDELTDKALDKKAKLKLRPRMGRQIVLTSGTTGTPKGAVRPEPKDYLPASALLSVFPLKTKGKTLIIAPMFHSWGLAALQIHLTLNSTMIMTRKFDPEQVLTLMERYQVDSCFLVPTMLHRILELDDKTHNFVFPKLKVLAASGSAIHVNTVQDALKKFGKVLYNFYGSTEVSWATIATPEELSKFPNAAGKAPIGTKVRILDSNGKQLPEGQSGRVFVGNSFSFEGYTSSSSTKEIIDGCISTGDLGHFENKILFIDGREDDMIVSGGENVYPLEVENVLSTMHGVNEVAVVGDVDEEFGKRLVAYIVRDDEGGDALTEDSVQQFVKQKLTRFCTPRDVFFIEELPRNATGKVVTRELPNPEVLKKSQTRTV